MGFLFPKAPKPAEAARMPTPEDTSVVAAEDRQRRQIAQRSGRASTVLSRPSGGASAGTTSYGNSLLGSAG
ncbi:hypothetical protein [Mesorhizobium sp. ESP-6-2]|uniref:hypothetical protein n=1 Tax=Mesorhizobium sp. ESP-6-2 TaxID=2876625 RepID=UPI001CCD50EF|nr:hypothetical protein [Mesorhizobium sp. ESP-6-2]MBZ9807687.1 hypothetical protein [Mesorhizobium sp. ESP-6-2]